MRYRFFEKKYYIYPHKTSPVPLRHNPLVFLGLYFCPHRASDAGFLFPTPFVLSIQPAASHLRAVTKIIQYILIATNLLCLLRDWWQWRQFKTRTT